MTKAQIEKVDIGDIVGAYNCGPYVEGAVERFDELNGERTAVYINGQRWARTSLCWPISRKGGR